MFSILKEIHQYIVENGIPFKNIRVSYTYFSKYVNQAILELVRGASLNNEFELGPREYTIQYDNQGQIYLLATDRVEHVNVVICRDPSSLDLDYPHATFSEKRVIRDACECKRLDDFRQMIREILIEEDINPRNRVELENKILNKTAISDYKRLKEEGRSILDMVDYEDSLRDTVTNLKKYIDYLNQKYQEEVISKEVMYGISYREPTPDSDIFKRGPREFGYKPTKDRKNIVMGAEERIEILERYPYVYKDYAFTANNKEIDYMVYLYNVRENEFVMIMEPYNGMKYTKVVILHKNNISRDEFNGFVKEYLELSNNEFALRENGARTSHTTIDTYKKSMKYAILGDNINNVTSSFKKRIRSIKDNR